MRQLVRKNMVCALIFEINPENTKKLGQVEALLPPTRLLSGPPWKKVQCSGLPDLTGTHTSPVLWESLRPPTGNAETLTNGSPCWPSFQSSFPKLPLVTSHPALTRPAHSMLSEKLFTKSSFRAMSYMLLFFSGEHKDPRWMDWMRPVALNTPPTYTPGDQRYLNGRGKKLKQVSLQPRPHASFSICFTY